MSGRPSLSACTIGDCDAVRETRGDSSAWYGLIFARLVHTTKSGMTSTSINSSLYKFGCAGRQLIPRQRTLLVIVSFELSV